MGADGPHWPIAITACIDARTLCAIYIYIYVYIYCMLRLKSRSSRGIRLLASAMFQRGAGPTEYEGCDPNVALQDEVDDIFAENILSGARSSILLGKAQRAGLKLAGKFIKKTAR